ncbi:MAG: M48 family metalloprotease [Phenylobacterium sp.]|uniref:M48 family metalloprotease n=1 Tax=Phenylobacterium sp. TaxID=1871053 RepID=UPI0025EDD31E|nr:M48 family metalloprotease [Phenylobacterium sp.]MBI1199475.1 M48 family metalloprotease [Phenylobacterium sp.]
MAQGFDPAAATAAYLAQLPPEAHAKAEAYTQGGHWLLLWGALVGVLSAWLILRSGVLVRLRARIERRRPRPALAVAAVIAVFAIADFVLTLPWSAYAGWWREHQYGLTSQALGGWLGEQVLNLALGAAAHVILTELIYLAIRRRPQTWWIWSGTAVAVFIVFMFVVSPVLVEPLFNDYRPAPPGPVRDAIVEMAEENGVPADKILIYDGSRQSNRYTANVSGLFGTARIAMSDVMFKKNADLAEVKGVVGHEMGHYVRGHAFAYSAAFGLMALAGFFLIDRLYPLVLRLAGGRGVGSIADPAGFPVIAMLLAVLGLLATPAINTIGRLGEADADSFSLEHVDEPDGLARALVKTIEYRAATPSKLEEILFYDHPSVGSRVRKCMDWKAAHPKPATPPAAPSAS